ncbi:AraC family transcriptional regulator [Myroides sp. N17-2]|uniref:helix-turn-helix domain-containing protein n=1 Tax=Myroides sp. N17-2 TaxID=2030799 RepID=UPI000EFD379D|nr:AraC family transcriptional regulator [Myroides sp. N17-2]
MLKEYSISDILGLPSQHVPYYVGTFEGTEDPDIEWPHRHSFFSLVWFTKGSGFYVIDFEEYEIKPDRIFLISPKQVHNWDYSENSKGYILTIDYAFGKELDINHISLYLDIKDRYKELLQVVFFDLIENFQKAGNLTIDIQYVYKQLERFITQNQLKYNTANSQLTELKILLAKNQQSLYTVEQYATKLNISTEQLNTLCKTHTGISAKQFILDLKITEAKRQLIYTTNNINEVAYNLGFVDSSYFSRIFKKKTNLSPSLFLRKYRNQD